MFISYPQLKTFFLWSFNSMSDVAQMEIISFLRLFKQYIAFHNHQKWLIQFLKRFWKYLLFQQLLLFLKDRTI